MMPPVAASLHPNPILLSGSSHPALAESLASELNLPLTPLTLETFPSGELYASIDESVRGADVFILATHAHPVNDSLMESLIVADAAVRASAGRVTMIVPFYPYARQDRKGLKREPITASMVAKLYKAAGVDRVMTLDLHATQIQAFFDGPFEHLYAMGILSDYIREQYADEAEDLVVVSPDAGRVKVAEKWTDRLGCPLAIIHKRRDNGEVRAFEVVGEVQGKVCVLVDDMVDTAGTITEAARTLSAKGAKKIIVASTHGVLSDPALERLEAPCISEVVLTDSLPSASQAASKLSKITVLPLAPLLARSIETVFGERSLSSTFKGLA